MIDMRYHDLLDWTEVRNEPILSETDIDCDNIKAIKNQSLTKLIMGHHIVACEEFYVHNNIVIYLERRKTIAPCIHCIRHATRFLRVRIYATSHDATHKKK